MSEQLKERRDQLSAYLSQLDGATINSAQAVVDENVVGDLCIWPRLSATLADGSQYELEISADGEGNGPGVVFGLPVRGQ